MYTQIDAEELVLALSAFKKENFDKSLELFKKMAPSSKIYANIGIIYLHLDEYDSAHDWFLASTKLDNYFSLAYFLKGVANATLGNNDCAIKDFSDCIVSLRGNTFIDYKQLGLPFTLRLAEILYNIGVCHFSLCEIEAAALYLQEAKALMNKIVNEWIEIVIESSKPAKNHQLFTIPKNIIFLPPESTFTSQEKLDLLFNKKKLATFADSNASINSKSDFKNKVGKTLNGLLKSSSLVRSISSVGSGLYKKTNIQKKAYT